ncbi:MAG: hypothetical protein JWR89_851 [Tardiphaga sp.]|jgi:hypothetical protein|uniref:hypothetical protein n=1 Tax=Tardiphaga sp. TaxID=1926292 RepID=UPI002611C49C|nr:hypothetical protein [Tardiphaga sp.]MDB5500949.1 hypothetical protein [Tardiphaga sp.]
MGQRQQPSNAETEGSAWLGTLVDTFERAERLGDVPCDPGLLSAARLRLQGELSAAEVSGDPDDQTAAEVHH